MHRVIIFSIMPDKKLSAELIAYFENMRCSRGEPCNSGEKVSAHAHNMNKGYKRKGPSDGPARKKKTADREGDLEPNIRDHKF